MKLRKRFVAAIGLIILPFVTCSFAQTGSDNPGGVAGGYNGQVTSGCSYDPYTGNATRAIPDIVLAGSAGAYPLAFIRYANSRYAIGTDDYGNGLNADFGEGASWSHSYQWTIDSVTKKTSDGKPKVFTVRYPDSRVIKFSAASNGDPYFRGGQAIADRLHVVWDSSTSGHADLIMPDGGYVHFAISIWTPNQYSVYTYTVQSVTDPYGQTTTITGSAGPGSFVTITEPAGRWLKLHYMRFGDPTYGDVVIDQVSASDGRVVQYNYTTYTDSGGAGWTVVDNVVYYGDSNLTARYTYQGVGGNPLLNTCIDPMYAGAMWKIGYKFAQGLNADGKTSAAAGQILSENYFDGTTVGPAVSTLSVDNTTNTSPKRTETRGDGPSRTFTYGAGLLASWTDYKGAVASQTYDNNGFVKTVTDFHTAGSGGQGGGGTGGNTTTFQRDSYTAVITKITYPATPTSCPSCTSAGSVTYVYGSSTCPDTNNRGVNLYNPTDGPNNYNAYYLYSVTDEAGNTSTVSRESNSTKRVAQKNYAGGGIESFTYNSFGEILTHRGTTGGLETNTYDGRGLLTQYRDPYHLATADPNNPSVPTTSFPTTLYTYDSFDRVYKLTTFSLNASDNTRTTTYTYNSRGDITAATLPTDPVDGQQRTISKVIDPMSATVTSITDQLLHTTTFIYDDYKRLLTATTPPQYSGDTLNHRSLVYYANGTRNDYTHTDRNVTYAILPSGRTTLTTYDENKRKISVTAASGTSDAATSTFAYDVNGNLISVVSPKEQPGQPFAGQSTTTTYDERNRPYSVSDPLGNVTSCTFDSGGRKKTVTRANGQVATFDSFDAMNRLRQSTVKQTPDPDAVTKYTYFTSGLLGTMQDPHLVAINSPDNYGYTYDLMGRKTQLTYPGGQVTERWHFDDHNRLDTFTNRNGNTHRTLYDSFDRPNNISWDDSGLTPTVTLSYDVGSRVTAINNANANISHAYYDDNLLKSETSTITGDGVARTVSYTYDSDSNHSSIQYPNNAYSFIYGYTQRNQVSNIYNGSTFPALYTYDPDGNLISRALDNSTSTSFTYDGLDRVTRITHNLNGTTRTFDYAYDSVSNRKWVKRDNGTGDVFGYDLADQSTSILLNVANPDTTSPGSQTINYDANGNRTTFSAYGPTDTYTTNNLNQYTQRNSSTASYDTKGNMTAGFDTSGYTYDAQDRILSASKGGTTDTFAYDGLNRQVKRTVGGAPAIYNVYDGWNLIAEYAAGATSPTTAYLGGVKILTTNRYYYQDASGSTAHLADNTGHLLEWYRYDLQGTPIVNDDPTNHASAFGVRHLFTGQQWYSELGLYDLRNRFYSPDIGRFLEADPLGFGGGDSNLYRYCTNNPTNFGDPAGLWQVSIFGGAGLGVYVTLGYNSGQWNFGAMGGVGSGFAGSINLADSGTHEEGMFGAAALTGGVGNGVSGMGVSGNADSSGAGSFTVVGNVGGITGGVTVPSQGESRFAYGGVLGGGAFAGGGYMVYGPPRTDETWEEGTTVVVTATYPNATTGGPYGNGYGYSFTNAFNRAYMSGVSTAAAMIGAAHVASAEVNAALEMGGFATSPGPMHGIAVSESASAGDGPSGPVVASMPAPPKYPLTWKWFKTAGTGGFSQPGGGAATGGAGQLIGYWGIASWTTDPSLAVMAPPLGVGGRHARGAAARYRATH